MTKPFADVDGMNLQVFQDLSRREAVSVVSWVRGSGCLGGVAEGSGSGSAHANDRGGGRRDYASAGVEYGRFVGVLWH